MTNTLRVNSDRMLDSFNRLAAIGATAAGGVDRPSLSEAHLAARKCFREEIERAGFEFRTDGAGTSYGLAYKEYDWLGPIYLPLDHFKVKTLTDVYRKHAGDMVTEPRASGGATYARAIPNCVAFGALTVDSL